MVSINPYPRYHNSDNVTDIDGKTGDSNGSLQSGNRTSDQNTAVFKDTDVPLVYPLYGIEVPPEEDQGGSEPPDLRLRYAIEPPADSGQDDDLPVIRPLYGIEVPPDGGQLDPKEPDVNQIMQIITKLFAFILSLLSNFKGIDTSNGKL